MRVAGHRPGPAPTRPVPRIWRRSESLAKALLPDAMQDWLRRIALELARRGKPESWLFREVPQERLRIFEEHLRALIECVRNSGAQLILSTHANRFQLPLTLAERRYLSAWRRFYPRAREAVLLDMDEQINAIIRSAEEARGVAISDVAKAVPPDPRNFHDAVHFTDRGSALAATTLAEAILRGAMASSVNGGRR